MDLKKRLSYDETNQFEIKCLNIEKNEVHKNDCRKLDKNGFDESQGWMYFYPVNYPIRDYQFKAVKKALFQNILLCLPTGLGKTFVGAVVMLNYYRWFPKKKVIFIAPTRPLVAQQMEACWNIVGIRYNDTAELTGSISPEKRTLIYNKCRVLFMTPQVLQNDISKGLCRPQDIICLVVDEAHRAVGNHSYCEVTRSIINIHKSFRILALSASPGGSSSAIQSVIDNLFISELIYYNEDHPDTKPYSHQRNIIPIVLTFEGQVKELVDKFSKKVENLLLNLNKSGGISNPKLISWSSYRLRVSLNTFKDKKSQFSESAYKLIVSQFHLTMAFVSAYERLLFHGVLAFCRCLLSESNEESYYSKIAQNELKKDMKFYDEISYIMSDLESSLLHKRPSMFPSHPKISTLEQILLQHFSKNDSRVIVFSQYRDSVDEIVSILNHHSPLLRVMHFVGQAFKKTSKGQTQKQQLEALKQFREGNYNVLVSTSVGEEGLDIGEVDLIICFDNSSSPLRLIQRIGRTGRKRIGKVIALLMKGKEESTFNETGKKSNLMEKILSSKTSSLKYCEIQRLIPFQFKPFCVKIKINTVKSQKEIKSKKECVKVPSEAAINGNVVSAHFNPTQTFPLSFTKPSSNISYFSYLAFYDISHSLKNIALHKIIYRSPPFNITPSDRLQNSSNHSNVGVQAPLTRPTKFTARDAHTFNMFDEYPDLDDILNEAMLPIQIRSIAKSSSIAEKEVNKSIDPNKSRLFPDGGIIFESDDDFQTPPLHPSSSFFPPPPPPPQLSTCPITFPSNNDVNTNLKSNEHDASEIILKRTKRKRVINSDDSDSVEYFDDALKAKSSKTSSKPKLLSRQFLLTQACVSGGDDSIESVVLSSDDNKYVADSFINDKEEETPKKSEEITKESLYKQSLLSPSVRKISFKTPPKLFSTDKANNWLETAVNGIEEKYKNNEYNSNIIIDDSMDDSLDDSVNVSMSVSIENEEEASFAEKTNLEMSSEIYLNKDHLPTAESNELADNMKPKVCSEPEECDQGRDLERNTDAVLHSNDRNGINNFEIALDLPSAFNFCNERDETINEESVLNERQTILAESKSINYSQIPSLLRNKYKIEILILQHMHFSYMLGHNIGLDVIKSSDLVKDHTISKIFKKYRKYDKIYEKIITIIQHDETDEILDVTPERIKVIHSMFKCMPSFNKILILFSNSQEKTALLMYNLLNSLDEKALFYFSVSPINMSKLMKRSSNLALLDIISPSVAMELLIHAKSMKHFIANSTPQNLMKYSSHITNYQAQLLHNIFNHFINLNST